MRILLDLDEVLVDFIQGVASLYGITKTELRAHWAKGEYDRLVSSLRAVVPLITPSNLWQRINQEGPRFWSQLPEYPWTDGLLSLVKKASNGEWYVVTSPSLSVNSYVGKYDWVKGKLGYGFTQLVLTNDKHLLANDGTILIDDREETILKFQAAGGHTILFPSHHNSNHAHSDDPLPYVLRELDTFNEIHAILSAEDGIL